MGKSKKKFQKNRQNKIERERRKKKKAKKRENLGLQKQRKDRNGHPDFRKRKRRRKQEEKSIKLPSNFSLLDNAEEVFADFNYYKEILERGYDIKFDLSSVNNITPEALAFLVANVADKNLVKNNKIRGNFPNDFELTKMLAESGFFKFVRSKGSYPKPKHKLIHKETYNKVEPKEAKEACSYAVGHTFESSVKFRPIYEILIECMANTNNHADNDYEGKYDWWLFVFKKEDGVTAFTFLDLGVGIFNSYPLLHHLSLKKFGNTNVGVVDDLIDGKIKSRTKKTERGQGIPHIYEKSKDDHFSKFYLITNDVFLDMKTREKKKLNYPLNGTLYYWEIKP